MSNRHFLPRPASVALRKVLLQSFPGTFLTGVLLEALSSPLRPRHLTQNATEKRNPTEYGWKAKRRDGRGGYELVMGIFLHHSCVWESMETENHSLFNRLADFNSCTLRTKRQEAYMLPSAFLMAGSVGRKNKMQLLVTVD